ncbi:MAG: ECF transporter S component [Clostridia bacterium]|nr:ECF transporter S component [Clostridia bacterium]
MNKTRRLVLSGLFLALGMLLPFLTAQNRELGNMLLPMHIPVLLCGFLCGSYHGAAVGAICPLLRSVWLSMPPLFPNAICMAFELAAYGLCAGLVYSFLAKRMDDKKIFPALFALIAAMLAGRFVWGAAAAVFYPMAGLPIGVDVFLTSAFISGAAGILIQIIIIPPIVCAMKNFVLKK